MLSISFYYYLTLLGLKLTFYNHINKNVQYLVNMVKSNFSSFVQEWLHTMGNLRAVGSDGSHGNHLTSYGLPRHRFHPEGTVLSVQKPGHRQMSNVYCKFISIFRSLFILKFWEVLVMLVKNLG